MYLSLLNILLLKPDLCYELDNMIKVVEPTLLRLHLCLMVMSVTPICKSGAISALLLKDTAFDNSGAIVKSALMVEGLSQPHMSIFNSIPISIFRSM